MKRTCARAIGGLIFSMVLIVSLTSSAAHGAVINTLLVGSSGTVTTTFNSLTFNNDPGATPLSGGSNFSCTAGGPCNNDVANGSTLAFAGCPSGMLGMPGCLTATEGIEVATISAATVGDPTFLQFANHSNLVFSLNNITTYGTGTPNPGVTSNCSTIGIGGTCVIYPGAAVLLLETTATTTRASIDVQGKASDTGVGGLLGASNYDGGWNVTLTGNLPNGMAPTPANIQLFFCGTNNVTSVSQCSTNGASLTTSNSGSFTAAAVPEPDSVALTMIGSSLIGLGVLLRRRTRI